MQGRNYGGFSTIPLHFDPPMITGIIYLFKMSKSIYFGTNKKNKNNYVGPTQTRRYRFICCGVFCHVAVMSSHYSI